MVKILPFLQNKKNWLSLLLPLAAAVAINIIIFSLGWDTKVGGWSLLRPPGPFIGAVWVVLFCLMGLSVWQARRSAAARAAHLPRWIAGLIALCAAYPFYTMGLQSSFIGLIGTIVTFIAALTLTVRVWGIARAAAWPLLPLLVWLVYASMITTNSLYGGS